MRLDLFIEGPLLRFAFVVFFAGIAIRMVFFLRAIVAGSRNQDSGRRTILVSLGRSLFPLHSGVKRRPLYASLRYVFHICLLVVPVFLSTHVVLWEQSRFQWAWTTLPDEWADLLTLLVLVLCIFFLARRSLVPEVRRSSTLSDYLFLFLVSLPFLTGYLLSHGTSGSWLFLEKNMWTLHVLSGEAVLIGSVFLFCRTRLIETRCTGCAACVISCPTGTLEAVDRGTDRIFLYSHYQCICCGSCVASCPEDAGELRHEVSLRKFLPRPSKIEIRSVQLEACEQCSALFVPEPQLREVLAAVTHDYPRVCSQCRKIGFSRIVSGLALSRKQPKIENHRKIVGT